MLTSLDQARPTNPSKNRPYTRSVDPGLASRLSLKSMIAIIQVHRPRKKTV